MSVTKGLEFLLSHFEVEFPRKVSTFATQNRQIEAYNKQEALDKFKEAQFRDCRINAFGRDEIEQEIPNMIFVDLDKKDALDEVRTLFYKEIGGVPTILGTGNGYAILQPIKMISMKGQTLQNKPIDGAAKKFLQFAERYLSNCKCDMSNHPSLKSCMIRVPYSINTKCKTPTNVTIIQEWDKNRVSVKNLPFLNHLKSLKEPNIHANKEVINPENFVWVERLLKSRIKDRRNFLLFDVCRYLINVKNTPQSDAVETIHSWLASPKYSRAKITYEVRQAIKDGKMPRKRGTITSSSPEVSTELSQLGV